MKHIYPFPLAILNLIVASGMTSFAQVPKSLDSLETYIQSHAPTDTNYIKALNRLGDLTSRKKADYTRADSLLRVSERLALKLDFGLGVTDANIYLGSNYYLTDQPQLALEYLQKAQMMAEKYKLSPRMRAQTITNVGVAHQKLKQFENAVETHLRSLRLQEQLNVQPRIPTTYEGLGLGLKSMKKPREAIGYFQQALELKLAAKNTYGAAITEHNIGRCYDDLNQEKGAIMHYKSALSYLPGTDYELLKADILGNIGLALRKTNRFQEAKPYLEQSLAMAITQKNNESISTGYFDLGRFYEELKDYKQAELYMKKALALANEREDKESIALFTQGLADLYGGLKDFQQAYVFQLQKNQRMDSTTTIRTSAQVQRLVAQYETEKKEAHIKLLQQQAQFNQQEAKRTRFRTNALLIGAVLLLLLGGAMSAWLLNRAKVRRLEEAQNLRKQIAHDLHDEVGSTLSSISMLSGHTDTLLSQNQPESAQKMVQKIYGDARQILESIDEIIWTINPGNDSLQRIAQRLREYAQPLMESKNIRFSFQIDPILEEIPISMEVRRNLYLIGKEAINNLVKYSQASEAVVKFERSGAQLRVLIEDNGRGFVQAEASTRNGQRSMQQRAEAMGGSLEVRSIPQQGTSLIFTTTLA